MKLAILVLGVLVAQPAQKPFVPQAQDGPAPSQQKQPSQETRARSGTVKPISTAGLSAVPFTTAGGRSGWRVKVPGGRALATPAVVDGVVFLGGGFGSHEFYAFDARTGAPRWA